MRATQLHLAIGTALLATLVLARPAPAQGTPIGFEEEFALSPDRESMLEQLIPGTEEYYYYRCLQLQHEGKLEDVGPVLKLWIERHGRGSRVDEIENRQALLGFERDPAAAFAFLRQRLGLRFDHQRQISGEKPDLPTRLDPEFLSPDTLSRRALSAHPQSLDGFSESALESLVGTQLSDALLMSLLQRLSRPDLPNLPALVVRNLQDKQSRGFGSLDVHRSLLLEQLEECARLMPALLRQDAFINAYLLKLHPGADVDWRRSAGDREAYLERLQQFTARLGPAHNSLKAHVLYHRLLHDLGQGRPDRDRFLAYLRLPRQASYVNPDYLKSRSRSDELVEFGKACPTDLEAVGNDEALVRAYLSHFLVNEDSYEPYAETVREDYLSRLFAETKILAGSEDMERWYSLLNDPGYYEQLKERVEIEFPPTQRTEFGLDDPVSIEVDLKNVDTLLVKVFRINTLNYHIEQGKEVDASISLDGLVANQETTYTYDEGPLRRVRRKFEFGNLEGPGVFLVDFIGNGLSSRAVIRKGRLQYLERQGSAGHVLQVLDGDGRQLKHASALLGGHEYLADEAGEILIPYSSKPGQKTLILRDGGFSTLEQFEHAEEVYQLAAGIFVERESLLPGQLAKIMVRPTLLLNGNAVSLDLLEQASLSIVSSDWHGVSSSLDVRDLEFKKGREFIHEIRVPERLSSLTVRLQARVKSLSLGKSVDLDSGSRQFQVSSIEGTALTSCPLLGLTDAGYVLDVLGKNGEPKQDVAVDLMLTHRHYTDPIHVTLKTDAKGRIALGPLEGIETVTAAGIADGFGSWNLLQATRTYPSLVQGRSGQVLKLPYQGHSAALTRGVASLLELRAGTYAHDRCDHLHLLDGYLELRDLAPGDYSLVLKEAEQTVKVRITSGAEHGDWAVGSGRLLQLGGSAPLHILGCLVEGDELVVKLGHAGAGARVHLASTRYLPAFDAFWSLLIPSGPGLMERPAPFAESSYHSGREIGDEYRYILERRYAKKFPGNMLGRPSLLLNPFALEETTSAIGVGGGAGGKFGGKYGGRGRAQAEGEPGWGGPSTTPGTFPNLEFLADPARVLVNLEPDADGVVRVPLADLGPGQLIHCVAVDGESSVYTSLALGEKERKLKDRRLKRALDSSRHLAVRKRIDFVDAGTQAVIDDVANAEVETYDSLASIHQVFQTLSGNPDLATFEFLLRWPELGEEEKRELYSRHACHELHFFLQKKDPVFFSEVVRPYLANKVHKTFLDRWLLGEDLRRYLDPWAFSRLNVVEQILLGRSLEGQADGVARHVGELLELKPVNPEQLDSLFETALRTGALETDKGLAETVELARKALKDAAQGEPAAAPAARPVRSKKAASKEEFDEEAEVEAEAAEVMDRLEGKVDEKSKANEDLRRRAEVRQLYRAPDRTRRFVEHNYWHRPIEEQDSQLITVNAFWSDYALARGNEPFFSTHFPEAAGSFAEMMLALAVIDLPFKAGEHAVKTGEGRVTVTAQSPLLMVRKEIREAESAGERVPILIHQNFFRPDDRYRYEGSERRDKFVTDEFLEGVVYGCQVVLTNPVSLPLKVALLLQVPQGAIPVLSGYETRGVPVQIGPYGTTNVEYSFYFPKAGDYPHYPVHASRSEELVASAEPVSLKVVRELKSVDTGSWEHISQSGTPAQVQEYLDSANLLRTDLTRVAWRMRDPVFFEAATSLLRRRHVFDQTLWSYGLYHKDAPASREFLRHQDGFLARCGSYLDSPLVAIDPIERLAYQHVEYAPLFNGRAHRFGRRHEILNPDLARQYQSLLGILGHRPRLDDTDWMSVTYYLLLQDRVEEALLSFGRVNAARREMALQYDYMRAYMDFFTDDYAQARGIAETYRNYPVERWRLLFQDVLNQLDEAAGKGVAAGDSEDRTQRQTELAAKEPSLELKVESQNVTLAYRNIESCEISYYVMDIEFLFSTSAFVRQGAGSFAYIQPNRSDTLALPPGEREF
ncbi:MAG: hypothetical protein V2A76_13705, partial [Planctomycetota bacterium]